MRDRYKDMIKRHEGLSLKLYNCSAGKLTVGYGFNLEDGISQRVADFLFDEKFNGAMKDAVGLKWFGDLSEVRQAVILDMLFNLGLPRFLGFKKMIYHLKERQYDYAAREMLNSKWAEQVGGRAAELAQIMDTGKLEVD